MVKLILGAKGAGKTRWLIEEANHELENGNGNIAFLDTDDEHIFSLKHGIRLINVKDYGVGTLPALYGFISGMLAMDFDLEKVYIDSIYKLIPIKPENLISICNELEGIARKSECEIYINVDFTIDEVPEDIKKYAIEVK
ncbi:MAG: hypothetical protein MSH08_06200 [Ezakiella sp.]|nr:hypothetical protein [Ezakiella sp.]MDD7471917.1 hypothetical protein [Bacillota bacterium]MDY3923881.1 hypothetical protein [Ezakiella sp.]